MKKTFLMAGAVAFAFCAMSLSGQELKINGDFKKVNPKTSFPVSWYKNGPNSKNVVCKIVAQDGKNILQISSPGKYFALYSGTREKVSVGDTFKVVMKAKGKVNLSVGYYAYAPKGANVDSFGVPLKIDSPNAFKEYTVTFKVKAPPKKHPLGHILFQFSCSQKYDLQLEKISVERIKTPAKK